MTTFFSNLLSRLTIQSKILVFIAPISLLIIAIAIVSLVTGQIIGQQIDGAGRSVGTLSEFKQTYTQINELLSHPSQEQHSLVVENLKRRSADFEEAIATQENPDVVMSLRAAKERVDGLLPQVDLLWEKFAKASAIAADIQGNLDGLVSEKNEISVISGVLQENLDKQDAQAKSLILKADFLSSSAEAITTIVSKVTAARSPQETFTVINGLKPQMTEIANKIGDALPDNQKVIGDTLKSNIEGVLEIVGKEKPIAPAVLKIERLMGGIRPMAIRLRGMGSSVARDSTKTFAELAKPMEEAKEIVSFSSQVGSATNDLLVKMAGFLADREKSVLDQSSGASELLKTLLEMPPPYDGASGIKALAQSMIERVGKVVNLGNDLAAVEEERSRVFQETAENIDKAWMGVVDMAGDQRSLAQKAADSAITMSVTTAVVAVVFAILATLALVGALKGPILLLTQTMKDVASGKLDRDVDGTDRRDEIGDMARALGVFRSNAQDKLRLEAEADETRRKAEEEQQLANRQREKIALELREAIDVLGGGLRSLAGGDLTCNIRTSFAGELDELRVNFNESVEHIRQAMEVIRDNSVAIQEKSQVLSSGAHDLARRTEQQASSLEETAAAVEEITSTVKQSSERAEDTNRVSLEILGEVEKSAKVVSDAVGAMGRIETASGQISQIIGTIDEIAFQTNLLALNAGVEAARAGEAGKGFAVVAQEVRELAQRSAMAANEIKQLIGRSGDEVKEGVRLVGVTGEVIARINQRIQEVSSNIADMARASGEQSTGLQEVNTAVNSMDQMTQRNAAMVEETNAASHSLVEEANELNLLVSRFKISGDVSGSRHQSNAA